MPKPGGTIYAIGTVGTPWVKIGCTTMAVEKRLLTLQTGQPFLLTILAAVAVEEHLYALERQLHLFLADTNHRGEWFELMMDRVILDELLRLAAQALHASEPPAPMHKTLDTFLTGQPQDRFWYERKGWRLPGLPAPAIPAPLSRPQERVCRMLRRHGDVLLSRLQKSVRCYGIGGAEFTEIVGVLAAKCLIHIYTPPGPLARRRVVWIGEDRAPAAPDREDAA